MDQREGKTIKERSPETQILVQRLRDVPVGGLATYGELERAIGQPVRPGTPGYAFAHSAIRIVRNEYNMTFINQRGDGYKHLSTEIEFVALAEDERKKVQRKCSEGIKRLRNARLEDFSQEARNQVIARMTVLSLQANAAKKKSIAKIEAAVKGDTKMIPIQEALKKLLEKPAVLKNK